MANELKGVVTFKDDTGTDWSISYPVNALINIEDATGKKISELLTELSNGQSLKLLRTFVFYGLKTHKPEVTEDEAGELMSFDRAAVNAAMNAIRLAFPAAKEGESAALDDSTKNV